MRRRESDNADDGKSGREYQLTKELMFGKMVPNISSFAAENRRMGDRI